LILDISSPSTFHVTMKHAMHSFGNMKYGNQITRKSEAVSNAE
jgi:hypothetical protein